MRNFFRILFLPITAPLDFITKYFKAILFLTILFFIIASMEDDKNSISSSENLAKVYLRGAILDAGGFLEELKKADSDNIKGVLVIVDSPGGLVAPSLEIALALKEIRSRKKVVVYSSGTMASGSYYASIWSDKIISNPGSMIGSIGVIFQGINAEKLVEKIGVEPQIVKAGKYKEMGAIYREWSEIEREEIVRVVNSQYKMFVKDVAEARGLNVENSHIFADGRVFVASEAKEVGLIDRVGNIRVAENELKVLSGVEKPIWLEESKFDKYMKRILSEATTEIISNLFFSKIY